MNFEGDAQPFEQFAGPRQRIERFEVGRAHLGPLPRQQARRGHAGALQADHQYSFAVHIHGYLSFNVVNANNASTRPAIQKRAMIFDSAQPLASK